MSRIPTDSTRAKIAQAHSQLTGNAMPVWASLQDMRPMVHIDRQPLRRPCAVAGYFDHKIGLEQFIRELHFTIEQLRLGKL